MPEDASCTESHTRSVCVCNTATSGAHPSPPSLLPSTRAGRTNGKEGMYHWWAVLIFELINNKIYLFLPNSPSSASTAGSPARARASRRLRTDPTVISARSRGSMRSESTPPFGPAARAGHAQPHGPAVAPRLRRPRPRPRGVDGARR